MDLTTTYFKLVPLETTSSASPEVTALKQQLATMTADRNRLYALVSEADRKQRLCVCGSPTGIVSPAVATELSTGKKVTVTSPVDGSQVDILFAV